MISNVASWIIRHRPIEINFISTHPMFEFNCILTCYECSILVQVVFIIRNGWLMKISREAHGSSPHGSSALLRNTSLIITKMVNVVFISIALKLSKSLLCVGASKGCLLGRNDTLFISQVSPVLHVELVLVHWPENLRVLPSVQVVGDPGLSYC